MGKKQEPIISKLNLESVVDNEIFPPEKNIFKKAKQKIEKIVFHNKNKIVIPLSIATGGFGYYYSYLAIEKFWDILKILRPGSSPQELLPAEYSLPIGLAVGAGTYIVTDDVIKNQIGKMLLGIKEHGTDLKKKKEDFLRRHKKELTLATWAATMAVFVNGYYNKIGSLSHAARQTLSQNADKAIPMAITFSLGGLGAIYLFFSRIGKISFFKSNEMKRATSGAASYKLSKKNGIRYLESESKKGNIYSDMILAEVEENIDRKLEYEKKVIEKIKSDKLFYDEKIDWVKLENAGSNYINLKKGNIESLISIAMGIYPLNPSRSIKLLNKLSDVKELDIKEHILSTKNYFLNIHEADKKEDWQELRSWLEKKGKLRLIEGSEGKTSAFFDDFTNKNFIFKDYKEDKTDKFFIERAILEILKGSGISVENPLFHYDEEKVHRQVFIRDGEKNLREDLENKSIPERRTAFERVLPLLMLYQQKIFSTLQKEGSEFVMNTEFRGEKRKVTIPLLDLEQNLRQKAFYGHTSKEIRLGENPYLATLVSKIQAFRKYKLHSSMLTFNHGDAFAPNITSELCIIDPRPTITHPFYDVTYFATDPAFLQINIEYRREKILEEMLKTDYGRSKESELTNAFDYLYFHNAICHAGSRLGHSKPAETEAILSELIDFSKDKGFQKELLLYLRQSNAKALLKII